MLISFPKDCNTKPIFWNSWEGIECLRLFIQKTRQIPQLPELKLGETVLIGNNIQKCLNWLLAKIIDLIPSKDSKIKNSTWCDSKLPIQRIFLLEQSFNNISNYFFLLKLCKQNDFMQVCNMHSKLRRSIQMVFRVLQRWWLHDKGRN